MECWETPDEGLLVRLDGVEGCESETDEVVWMLLDAWKDITHVWQDDAREGEESDYHTSHEVEDGMFVCVTEERLDDGRTNYDREVEIEELIPADEEDAPEYGVLVEKLREWRE